jgi:hypothetical protein
MKSDPITASDLKQLDDAFKQLFVVTPIDTVTSIATESRDEDSPKACLVQLRFAENEPNVAALASFLWRHAVTYALSRRRRLKLHDEIARLEPGDMSGYVIPVNAARDAFIEFNKTYPGRASEVGEVLAYCIAMHHLGAVQVAAKMSLKTAANMAVHGLDGIHAKVENGALTVYFLESKLSGSANDGVSEYATSATDFLGGTKKYLLEFSIVRDLGNLDTLQGSDRELALRFFDVIGEPDAPRRQRYIGVVCYSETKLYGKVPPVAKGQEYGFHEKWFASRYTELLQHHWLAARKHLSATGVELEKCSVYFVAVPDVNRLRELFYEQMHGKLA